MTDDVFEIRRYGGQWTLRAGANDRHIGSPHEGEIEAYVMRWAGEPHSARVEPKEATMADDTNIRGPQDRNQINLTEDYEVRYWTKKFGVRRDELARAVSKVGSNAAAVAKELGKNL